MQKPRSMIDADQMSLPASPRWFWVAYLLVAGAIALAIIAGGPGLLAWWLL